MKDEDKSKSQLIDELQEMRKRVAALTQPLEDMESISFEDMFSLSEIQHLQDLYAETFGVAALITRPDGTPITQPSNFTVLCSQFIRNTEKGSKNCNISDAIIGQHNPDGPIIQPCLSAGLCNAGVSITVRGYHVANWLIGQVRNEGQKEEDIMAYARELGLDENAFLAAYYQVPVMSQEQFERVAQVLFMVANQLSISAFQNIQQARFIAERKRIEESLKLTQFCFDNAAVGIFQIAVNGRILNANPYAARMLGYTPEELAKLSISDIDPFVSADTLDENIDRLNACSRTNFETVHIRKDGSRIPVEITGNIFEYRGQRYSVAFVQDITERKQTEVSLRLAKAVFDKAPIGIWRMGTNGEVLDVNDAGCASLGYSRKKLLQMKVFDFAPGFTAEHWAENTKILNEAGIKTTEVFHQNKNGKIIPVQVIENLMRFEDQEFLVVFVQDITERKRNEEALRERDQLLHDIGKLVKVGAWKYDIETGKATWTDEVSRIHDLESNQEFGIEEGLGFYHGVHREKIERAFNELVEQGIPYDLVIELVSAKDIRKWVRTIGYPVMKDGRIVQVQGAIQDITERKRMEEMMIQSEKMLSVGGLAAGMAHEINNPLAGMMQSANVIKCRLRDIDMPANLQAAKELGVSMEDITAFMEKRNIFRMIDAIHKSGARAAEIVNSMLSFARKSDTAVSSHYPDQLMDGILELAATSYDLKKQYDFKSIKIIKEYADNLPMLPCEGAKIQQVLLNILRNGAQAMQTAKTKSPRFILRIFSKGEPEVVHIEIEDNGPGMDEQTRLKVFEPFFTTKPVGVGTGLGLSVSYFIITENHKGTMDIISEPGKGSNFIIRLPIDRKN